MKWNRIIQILVVIGFGLFLFSPASAQAGRCCYYSLEPAGYVFGSSLGCLYNDGIGNDSVVKCEILLSGEKHCFSNETTIVCPLESEFVGYDNLFGAKYTESNDCSFLEKVKIGEDYYDVNKHSFFGSGAKAVCSVVGSLSPEYKTEFDKKWAEAESKVIVTGFHNIKCLCWEGRASAGAQTCSFEDSRLDFNANLQTEAEFQSKYVAKCTSLNSGTKTCGAIVGYTKDTNLGQLAELEKGQQCDVNVKSHAESSGKSTLGSGDPIASLRGDIKGLNKLGTDDINIVFANMIKAGLGVLGSLALLMIVYGGGLWMSAAGNAEREKKGLEVLVWAGLGIVIIFASYAILDMIFDVFSDF